MSFSSQLQNIPGALGLGGGSNQTIPSDFVATQKAIYQSLADEINNTGGLAGCKVDIALHDLPTMGSGTLSANSQAECSDFAEDQHVFAVVAAASAEDKTLISCLADHKVVTFWGLDQYQPTKADFDQYKPYLYGLDYITPDRLGNMVDKFDIDGFLSPGAKVGILVADDGSGHSQQLADEWKQGLSAKGISSEDFKYHQVTGFTDLQNTTTALGSAILQFKKDGVNRVLFTLDNVATLFFPNLAAGQGFKPRYGLTSVSAVAAFAAAPAAVRTGGVALSFQSSDTISLSPSGGAATASTGPANPNLDRCNKVFAAGAGSTASLPAGAANMYCEPFFFLQAALKGAKDVTPETLRAGADALGDSYPLVGAYGTAALANGRGDAANSVQVLKWDDAKSSWAPVGDPVQAP